MCSDKEISIRDSNCLLGIKREVEIIDLGQEGTKGIVIRFRPKASLVPEGHEGLALSLLLRGLLAEFFFPGRRRIISSRDLILALGSTSFRETLACCASMNEMPRVKSEDEIRRDLGVGRFIFRTGYNMELLNSPAIC